jgi:hypothetical protein
MVVTGMALVTFQSPAPATILQTVGGPGGAPFELRCAQDEHMIGVRANVGAWVDGLAILCAKGGSTTARRVGWIGGRGGMDQEAYCPSGGRALSFDMNFTRSDGVPRKFLNGLSFQCETGSSTCIDSGQGCDWVNQPPSVWTRFSSVDRQSCPKEEVLVGLVGRSGDFVDAIGAICEPPSSGDSSQASPETAADASSRPQSYSDRPSEDVMLAAQKRPEVPEGAISTEIRAGDGPTQAAASPSAAGEVVEGSSDGARCLNPQPLPPRDPRVRSGLSDRRAACPRRLPLGPREVAPRR